MSNRHRQEGEFKLTLKIEKAHERTDSDGVVHRYIAGIATGTTLDRDHERMATTAIDAIKQSIDDGIVLPNGQWSLLPLRKGHKKEWDDVLGWVVKAEIDSDYNLWIEAELDDISVAHDLYHKLTKGTTPGRPLQLGFSVGGRVLAADFEWNAELNKKVRVFKDIRLTEISVVGSPAYPTAYVEALEKSVRWNDLPADGVIAKEHAMSDMEKTITEEAAAEQVVEAITTETVADGDDAEKARRVIRENYSSTNSSSSETVIEDDETDVTPETVTIHLSEQDKDASEEVIKTDETDPSEGSVLKMLQQLVADFGGLRESVTALQAARATVAVEEPITETAKAADDAVDSTEDVEKAVVAQAVEAGIRKIVEDLKLNSIAEEMQALKAVVEELAAEPIDKSISVAKQKQEDELTPIEKFHRETQNPENRKRNPIEIAVRTGYQGMPNRQ